MPAVDIETLMYARIWTILNARAEFVALVPVQNQERYDTVVAGEDPGRYNTVDSDHGSAKLVPVSGSSDLRTADETFGTYSENGCSEFVEKGRYLFRLMTISSTLKIGEINMLGAESRQAFRDAGARLGLSFVTGVTLRWDTNETDRDEAAGTLRWKTNCEISIEIEHQGSAMTG